MASVNRVWEITYLYCNACTCAALGISQTRLAHQRNIRRQLYQRPVIQMTKVQVEEQHLGVVVEGTYHLSSGQYQSIETQTYAALKKKHSLSESKIYLLNKTLSS